MDVDKLIRCNKIACSCLSFGPLMDVDKLILDSLLRAFLPRFGPLMDVDKLIRKAFPCIPLPVLGL